ncbi:glutamine synthetase family protein [Frigidibacter sp. RF13]|uniref:glutamine synthetase family protein n=1 Tax=Frigidibacter sp. RF13 TaxID=2997340 RepID=UPI002270D0D1|nr:glutamine synthetase family protein [Frigidibacter sp. RF13]MCY1127485.1 glutamine synthetase family protein [Frigidibacter sp. RF13]
MTELLTFVTTDYAGITRGRSIPAASFTPGRPKSVGWVPANMSLTPFDQIADHNPWGSSGDLRLLGDEAARYRVTLPGAATPTDMMMSDIVELDGTPWPLCPRTFLRTALDELKSLTGLTLQVSFEHEFQLFGTGWAQAPAFSLRALRQADPFGPDLMAALDALGMKPEVFIAEYGRDQFEVTMAPTEGVTAADRAVVLREVTRELASLRGWQASFAPKTAVEGVGNGVHIHFSFADAKGTNATFDPTRPGRVSATAGAFAAGVIRHLPALVAFTAPSPISYLRLKPHNWSSSYTWFGDRDREASLRICPVTTVGGADPARAYNLEYRAADACACPHLALAVIVRAGIEGLKRRLPDPPLFSGDPELLPPAERAALGLERLPLSLEAALERFLGDPVAMGWFTPLASETYVGMKRTEIALAGHAIDDDLCRRYAGIY